MTEITISKFKATCLAVLAGVRKTGVPIRVTRRGEPIAEIVPPKLSTRERWLGSLEAEIEISGDLVGPVGAFEGWPAQPAGHRPKKRRS